ncbi:MAG: GNAT family N-acetyltransferase [Caulobacteraceae bacterium]
MRGGKEMLECEKVSLIEKAAVSFAIPAQDSQIMQLKSWFQITTPSAVPNHNIVLYSKLNKNNARKKIIKTINNYANLGLSCRWMIGPWCKPRYLDELLINEGMEKVLNGKGLIFDLRNKTASRGYGVSIEPLSDHNINDYAYVSFGDDPRIERLTEYFRYILKNPQMDVHCFLARINGEAAGIGALRIYQGMGNLNGGIVHPKYRGNGVYKALLSHRLNLLKARNIPYAAGLMASETSAPICRKFGFSEVCDVAIYESRPSRRHPARQTIGAAPDELSPTH